MDREAATLSYPRELRTMFGFALCRRWLAAACAFGCLAVVGCASPLCSQGTPKIDPSGQRLFTYDTPYKQVPGPVNPRDMTAVMVTPSKVIAPVGSEVVVQAAVCGQDKTLMAGKKVEWSIAPNSVGYFVQAGESGPWDWMHHAGYRTKKIDNTFAVSATSAKFVMLNRGTPTPTDDVPILRGQAWTTVSSPTEGTSYVTAVAPDVHAWHAHKQTAQIHWVDSQWTFPTPAVNPTGTRHAFTTTVLRHSNHCPLVGWRVRYQIAGGPQAGFAPDGVQVVEVVTNSLGQATVEIFQTNPLAGTNVINVAVIRPADWPTGDGSPLVVGSGTTQMTWTTASAGGGLWIDQTGPSEAVVGGTLTYRIVVRNPSDLTAKGLVVTENVPTGLTFVGSTPQAQVAGNALTWILGDLAGGQSRQIDLTFQAAQPAVVNSCATVRSADGASAQDCAVTTITQPSVELTLVGPPQSTVGEEITFVATITNRGSQAASGLVILDRFDVGLNHEQAGAGPIENRELGTLAPGETRRVNVRLRVLQPGRWCNTMELTGDNGVRTSAQSCTTAVAATAPPTGSTPPPSTPPAAGNQPVLVVRKSGPTRAAVGEKVLFTILVENRGTVPATNVKVLDNYDSQFLNALQASEGWQRAGNDVYWILPQLPPNYSYKREVEVICTAPGQRICNRVTVTTQEGTRHDAEACLEITGQRAPLTVSIGELRDPVSNGQEAAYDVRVTNNAAVADREVTVVVTLPNEMTPAAGTTGPTQFALNGRTLRFAPVAEIRPGETLTFQIRATARQAVDASQFRVDVTSTAAPQPITETTTTRIVP